MNNRFLRSLALLVSVWGVSFSSPVFAQTATDYKAAIFVTNRAGSAYDDKIAALEDYVTSGVTDQGLSVISRETALNAVGGLDPKAAANELDKQLSQSTSAVRLAQTLGADFLLQVTLTSFTSVKNTVNAYGVKTTNDEKTVRVSYKVLDGVSGASLIADTVKASRTVQATSTAGESDNSGILDELLEQASQKVAASLKTRIARGRLVAPAAGQNLVTVTIGTEIADVMIPDVRIGAENTVSISESKYKVSALSATVEVDGIAIGTAPGEFQVKPGLSKIRVLRDGFEPYERTVNFTNGLRLSAPLRMNAATYARWQDATAFINDLKNGAKLTDGQVKVLEGQAKMLEQSGFKVNTTEGITIKNQSIFD
ncbi:MAG: PEGA domain-containing protein [Opitutus sp.]|nr:PEGA domain-containing protein [Opitutus sp.]